MRFPQEGKPVLGFYAAEATRRRVNLTNVLQLEVEFPHQVKLARYSVPEHITAQLAQWLPAWARRDAARQRQGAGPAHGAHDAQLSGRLRHRAGRGESG